MKIKTLFLSLVLVAHYTSAQTGVSSGLTILKSFGIQKPYTGMHIGVEIPRDDEQSFFGRVTFTLKNKVDDSLISTAIDPTTTFPQQKYADTRFGFSYLNFEGGTRYYIGSGYDFGWSAYGGTIFGVSISNISRKTTDKDFDESKYEFVGSDNSPYPEKGRIIALNLGLNAGVKNHFVFGMLYFDVTLGYSILALPSNNLAAEYNQFSQLMFSFNLGFRKDIF